jgi:TIR domain
MKVFISWSGTTSRAVALALRDWLPSVLQVVEPFVSSEDVEKGARWDREIGQELENASFGILCITPDNVERPWLNFEAGALSKSMTASRVSPFLMGLRPADLVGPLTQFQATLPQVEDVGRLVKSINATADRPIDEPRLLEAVAMWWPRLEKSLQAALKVDPIQRDPQRDIQEMVEELLEINRAVQKQIIREEIPKGRVQLIEYDPAAVRSMSSESSELFDLLYQAGIFVSTMSTTDDVIVFALPAAPDEELQAKLDRFAQRHGTRLSIRIPISNSKEIEEKS